MKDQILQFIGNGDKELVKIQRHFCRFGPKLVSTALNELLQENKLEQKIKVGGFVFSRKQTGEEKANK